jgi:hypothetical protein
MKQSTHGKGTLSLDGDHENTLSVGNDFLADLGRLGTEIGASNNTKLDLTVDNECEADGELLMPDEAGSTVDY